MSIIYEALKKVEASQGKVFPQAALKHAAKPKIRLRPYLLFALLASFALLAGNLFLNAKSRRMQEAATALEVPALLAQKTGPAVIEPMQITAPAVSEPALLPAPEPQSPAAAFVLNGIFFSDDEGYALINNQIAKVGDTVEGAKVKRISQEEVELENAGETLKLVTVR